MKIAVIHDWLVTYAGAERALEQILLLYPDADLYSLIDFLPPGERGFILNKKVQTSFIQSLPFAKTKYRSYLPFMPFAVEQFDLAEYDLIISSSYAVVKGVLTHSRQLHVSYCYSPMRYIWDLHHQYVREAGLDRGATGLLARMIMHYVRMWDAGTANRVDSYIAISDYIAQRIAKVYDKQAAVIHPPVDTESFTPGGQKEDYYLTASRMVPYKRMDLIVEAFAGMPEKKLVVIGEGPDLGKIRAVAGSNVEFAGFQPPEALKQYVRKAKAFVYAADEDFGIVTVEAQACGTPVIAFGRGGSLETVIDGETGIFFREQTVPAVQEAVRKFEACKRRFDDAKLRANAERFGKERFRQEFKKHIDAELEKRRTKSSF